jgi:hypothetical protein
MDEPKQRATSVYDYSDKSVPQAGYAAVAYGVISLFTGLLVWIRYLLYHKPGHGGWLHHDYVSQQWLQNTPLQTGVAVVFSVLIAGISGVLAFGIFRRNRAAVIAMLIFVVVLQLYTWFVARSLAGTLVTIVVAAFLLRGAKRIFQDHAEREIDAGQRR